MLTARSIESLTALIAVISQAHKQKNHPRVVFPSQTRANLMTPARDELCHQDTHHVLPQENFTQLNIYRVHQTILPVRGQVAHGVSTYEGAKTFCSSGRTPPAEWRSVFDSAVRLAEKKNYVAEHERPNVEVYELDSDYTGMTPRVGEVNSNI